MPMRVTQGMMNTQLLRNLGYNMSKMDDLQNELASGRRINKPSDDPVGISFAMRYRSDLSANDQFQSNMDSAQSWLDYSDTVMDQADQVLQRVRELAVQGSNSTNPQTAMDSIKSEVDQLYKQLVQIGNSQLNGKYVFNGQMINTKPYDETNAESNVTDTGDIHYEIGPGVQMPLSVNGNQVFGNVSDTDNAFATIKQLSGALSAGDYSQVSGLIGTLDSRIDKFLEVRADLGARANRLDSASNRLKDVNTNLQGLLSKTEDADMAQVITNLKMSQNVYQASLSAGAQLIKPSLVDFLR